MLGRWSRRGLAVALTAGFGDCVLLVLVEEGRVVIEVEVGLGARHCGGIAADGD